MLIYRSCHIYICYFCFCLVMFGCSHTVYVCLYLCFHVCAFVLQISGTPKKSGYILFDHLDSRLSDNHARHYFLNCLQHLWQYQTWQFLPCGELKSNEEYQSHHPHITNICAFVCMNLCIFVTFSSTYN